MSKGYIVVTYRRVKDPDKLAAYAKLAGPAVAASGGKLLVRAKRPCESWATALSATFGIARAWRSGGPHSADSPRCRDARRPLQRRADARGSQARR